MSEVSFNSSFLGHYRRSCKIETTHKIIYGNQFYPGDKVSVTFQFVLSYWDLLGLHVRVFPRPLDNLPDDYNCFTSSAVF